MQSKRKIFDTKKKSEMIVYIFFSDIPEFFFWHDE